jgi:hypothetical protein
MPRRVQCKKPAPTRLASHFGKPFLLADRDARFRAGYERHKARRGKTRRLQ